ncbi:MAG: hypothetical protein V4459_02540 [Pseudomonadota bacterium]
MGFIGWKLDRRDRAALLKRFIPSWADVVADHVTLAVGTEATPLPLAVDAKVVGIVSDGEGLEALIVEIDGKIERPDGKTFHITWSLDRSRGRRAFESSSIIAKLGYTRLEAPVAVQTFPARID